MRPPRPLHAAPPGPDSPVAGTFCLLCLDVEEVDHVQLVGNRRHTYTRQAGGGDGSATGQWVRRSVNP